MHGEIAPRFLVVPFEVTVDHARHMDTLTESARSGVRRIAGRGFCFIPDRVACFYKRFHATKALPGYTLCNIGIEPTHPLRGCPFSQPRFRFLGRRSLRR